MSQLFGTHAAERASMLLGHFSLAPESEGRIFFRPCRENPSPFRVFYKEALACSTKLEQGDIVEVSCPSEVGQKHGWESALVFGSTEPGAGWYPRGWWEWIEDLLAEGTVFTLRIAPNEIKEITKSATDFKANIERHLEPFEKTVERTLFEVLKYKYHTKREP